MLLTEAIPIANELRALMHPYCDRIEIAGSVRRQKEFVNDIELCLIPKPGMANKLFNRLGIFLLQGNPGFKYIKNGDKYKQFIFSRCKIDLFITTHEQWGLIFLIRTGPADYGKSMLSRWKYLTKGGYSKDGFLYTASGEKVITPEETDVFALCKSKYKEPEFRE